MDVFGWLQANTVTAVWIAAAAIHREKNTVEAAATAGLQPQQAAANKLNNALPVPVLSVIATTSPPYAPVFFFLFLLGPLCRPRRRRCRRRRLVSPSRPSASTGPGLRGAVHAVPLPAPHYDCATTTRTAPPPPHTLTLLAEARPGRKEGRNAGHVAPSPFTIFRPTRNQLDARTDQATTMGIDVHVHQ
jgi:hypothetical protein